MGILILIRILVLVGLVRLLVQTEKPLLCSAIYAALGFAARILLEQPLRWAALATLISFALASLYFWLLDRFHGSGWFWVILVLGIAIGLV